MFVRTSSRAVLRPPVTCWVGASFPGFLSTLRRHHICPATHTDAYLPRLCGPLAVSHDLEALLRPYACGLVSCRCHPWVSIRSLQRPRPWISPRFVNRFSERPPSRISPFEPRTSHTDARGDCFSSHGLGGPPTFVSGSANDAFNCGLARTWPSPSATEVARPKSKMVVSRPSARVTPLGRADVPTCSSKCQRTRRLACLFRELPSSLRFASSRALPVTRKHTLRTPFGDALSTGQRRGI